jgi:cyclic lactone autoinducer peptide
MKTKITEINAILLGFVAFVALLVATNSVGTTCFFTAYQPTVPNELLDR